MDVFGDRMKLVVKTFRRECHRVLQSERTTIHGADGMLMMLQLAVAEVNKQVKVYPSLVTPHEPRHPHQSRVQLNHQADFSSHL